MDNTADIQLIGDAKRLHRSEKGGVGYYYRQYIASSGTKNCVPTAIAILQGAEYYTAIDKMLLYNGFRISPTKGTWTERFIDSKYGSGFKKVYSSWLHGDQPERRTPAGFAALNPEGKFLIQLRGHVIALINGTVYEFEKKKMNGQRVHKVWKLIDESVLINQLKTNSYL